MAFAFLVDTPFVVGLIVAVRFKCSVFFYLGFFKPVEFCLVCDVRVNDFVCEIAVGVFAHIRIHRILREPL